MVTAKTEERKEALEEFENPVKPTPSKVQTQADDDTQLRCFNGSFLKQGGFACHFLQNDFYSNTPYFQKSLRVTKLRQLPFISPPFHAFKAQHYYKFLKSCIKSTKQGERLPNSDTMFVRHGIMLKRYGTTLNRSDTTLKRTGTMFNRPGTTLKQTVPYSTDLVPH